MDALRAATSNAADAFRLTDRGRIAVGQRADLLLVRGDPTEEITATRNIVLVWKSGVELSPRVVLLPNAGDAPWFEKQMNARARNGVPKAGMMEARRIRFGTDRP